MFENVKNHNSLIEFYRENGLEVSNDIETEDGAVVSLALTENGKVISAATLSYRFGVFILDYRASHDLSVNIRNFAVSGRADNACGGVKFNARKIDIFNFAAVESAEERICLIHVVLGVVPSVIPYFFGADQKILYRITLSVENALESAYGSGNLS